MAEAQTWHTRSPGTEAASRAAQPTQPARDAAQLALAEQ